MFGTAVSTNLIITAVIIISIIVLSLMIKSWIKAQNEKTGEKVLLKNSIQEGYTPVETPKNKKFHAYTLTADKAVKVGTDIYDCIHTFGKDDVLTILTKLKDNVKTKTDMSLIVAEVNTLGKKLYDVLNTDLDGSQKKTFGEWLSKLPEYVYG